MPCIVTTLHDPVALGDTCRRCRLHPPHQSSRRILGDGEVFGWVVYLPGLRHDIVVDTLTGLVAYHTDDNAFHRYSHIMRFIRAAYDVQAQRRRDRRAHVA